MQGSVKGAVELVMYERDEHGNPTRRLSFVGHDGKSLARFFISVDAANMKRAKQRNGLTRSSMGTKGRGPTDHLADPSYRKFMSRSRRWRRAVPARSTRKFRSLGM